MINENSHHRITDAALRVMLNEEIDDDDIPDLPGAKPWSPTFPNTLPGGPGRPGNPFPGGHKQPNPYIYRGPRLPDDEPDPDPTFPYEPPPGAPGVSPSGTGDPADYEDDDGDGINNMNDPFPTDPSRPVFIPFPVYDWDTDGDGFPDFHDPYPLDNNRPAGTFNPQDPSNPTPDGGIGGFLRRILRNFNDRPGDAPLPSDVPVDNVRPAKGAGSAGGMP
jgi:hypothetical protein